MPASERDVMEIIVNRIYNQSSVSLTDDELGEIVKRALLDPRWALFTDDIANQLYRKAQRK